MRFHPVYAGIVLLITAAQSPAALLFDFGPTEPLDAETNSPFHAATGSLESFWNVIGRTDVSTLYNSDGTLATGLSLNIGSVVDAGASTKSTLIDLTSDGGLLNSNALGTVVNSGVFSGTSVGRDAIYKGSNGTEPSNQLNIGFQLAGLSAGTYDVYLVTRNTNAGNAYTMTSHIGAGISGQNFDFSSGFLSQTLSYPVANDAAAWTEGVNYTRLTITLEEGEALNVAVSAAGAQSRGFLNAAAIVPVPEPTAALSAIGGLCVLIGFRRARRS